MELSKFQIIAMTVLTTIITDKFLINHNYNPPNNQTINQTQVSPIPTAAVSISPVVAAISPIQGTNSNTQNEIILKEIQNLRKDMVNSINEVKSKTNSDDLAPTTSATSPLIGGMVKISSPQWKKVDVHEKALSSSKIIGSIIYDTIYFYRTKQNDWYQVDIDNGQLGWVQSQFLNEFP